MRKLTAVLTLLVAVLLMGVTVASPGATPENNDNGNASSNDNGSGNGNGNGNGSPLNGIDDHPAKYGLCTAYFNGEGGENGNKNNAGPFAQLEEEANEQGDDDASTEENVADFCRGTRPSNGQGNGNQDDSSAPDPAPEEENG